MIEIKQDRIEIRCDVCRRFYTLVYLAFTQEAKCVMEFRCSHCDKGEIYKIDLKLALAVCLRDKAQDGDNHEPKGGAP